MNDSRKSPPSWKAIGKRQPAFRILEGLGGKVVRVFTGKRHLLVQERKKWVPLIFQILTTGTGPTLQYFINKGKNHSKVKTYKEEGQQRQSFFFSREEMLVIFKSLQLFPTDVRMIQDVGWEASSENQGGSEPASPGFRKTDLQSSLHLLSISKFRDLEEGVLISKFSEMTVLADLASVSFLSSCSLRQGRTWAWETDLLLIPSSPDSMWLRPFNCPDFHFLAGTDFWNQSQD